MALSEWINKRKLLYAAALGISCIASVAAAQGTNLKIDYTIASTSQTASAAPPTADSGATLTLGPGDVVAIQVYGRRRRSQSGEFPGKSPGFDHSFTVPQPAGFSARRCAHTRALSD